jgi:hypothetical protein
MEREHGETDAWAVLILRPLVPAPLPGCSSRLPRAWYAWSGHVVRCFPAQTFDVGSCSIEIVRLAAPPGRAAIHGCARSDRSLFRETEGHRTVHRADLGRRKDRTGER